LTVKNQKSQHERGCGFHEKTERDDGPAAEPVGDIARDQNQKKSRKELREAREPKIERTLSCVVDLPADRDPLDLNSKAGRQPHRKITAETGPKHLCKARDAPKFFHLMPPTTTPSVFIPSSERPPSSRELVGPPGLEPGTRPL